MKLSWNIQHNERRIEGKKPFRKNDFSPESPKDLIPLSIYQDASIQSVEEMFVHARDQKTTNTDQLKAINSLQNRFRSFLRTLPQKTHLDKHLTDYRKKTYISGELPTIDLEYEGENRSDVLLCRIAEAFRKDICEIPRAYAHGIHPPKYLPFKLRLGRISFSLMLNVFLYNFFIYSHGTYEISI